MIKYSIQIGILRKKKGKEAIQIRTDQHTSDGVAALQDKITEYIGIFDVEEDEFTGGDLTQIDIETGDRALIGKIAYDGTLTLYTPISDSCIYCGDTPKGTLVDSVYFDGKCRNCDNSVIIKDPPPA